MNDYEYRTYGACMVYVVGGFYTREQILEVLAKVEELERTTAAQAANSMEQTKEEG